MRIVFMGSAELAVPALKIILESEEDEVVGVVTQPDRPAGRKRSLTPCPLKSFAEQGGLKVMTPERVGEADSLDALSLLNPDLIVVVAYGQYIPTKVIELATYRAINVHPSLLPKYRGAAPIQWAIANGDTVTGVSIIDLASKMDAGDIIRQEPHPIDSNDTSETLHNKLAVFGADLLVNAISDIREGTTSRVVQDEAQVVEIRKLTKEDGKIDWAMPAKQIHNRIRAFNPWPGSFCYLPSGEVLKVWRAELVEGDGQPGEVMDDQLLISTSDGSIRLVEVQPDGKKRMPTAAFLNGHPIAKGMQLG